MPLTKRIILWLPPIAVLVIWGISCFYSASGNCVINHKAMIYGLEPGGIVLEHMFDQRATDRFQSPTLKWSALQPREKLRSTFLKAISKWAPEERKLRITTRHVIPVGYFFAIALAPLLIHTATTRLKRKQEITD